MNNTPDENIGELIPKSNGQTIVRYNSPYKKNCSLSYIQVSDPTKFTIETRPFYRFLHCFPKFSFVHFSEPSSY